MLSTWTGHIPEQRGAPGSEGIEAQGWHYVKLRFINQTHFPTDLPYNFMQTVCSFLVFPHQPSAV